MSASHPQAENDDNDTKKPRSPPSGLGVSASAVVSDAEAVQVLMKAEATAPDLNGFSLDAASDDGTAVGGAPDDMAHNDANLLEVDTSHFADFHFPAYHGLSEDDHAIVALPEDTTVDLFGPSSPPSPSQDEIDLGGNVTGTEANNDADICAEADQQHDDNPRGTETENEATTAGEPARHISQEITQNILALPAFDAMAVLTTSAPRRRSSFDMAVSENGSTDSNGGGGVGGNSLLDEPISDEFGLVPNGRRNDSIDLGGGGSHSRQPMIAKEDRLGDVAPPWSELKTKAGKERKRLPLACIACRRKKIRCSGEKPACKHCLRSRTPCVYKVTARKAAPRTDYMAMLDKRLKRMEERIIKIVPKAEQDVVATSSVTRAVVKPSIPGPLPGPSASAGGNKASAKKRGADEAFGPELDHWARANTRNRLSDAARPHTILLQQESEESKLLQEGAEALPSRELQEHLAEIYFENIYGQAYHLLHKPSYMRKLKAGTLPPVLILSVCAISARFSSHPGLGTGPNFLRGEEWASHARDIVTRRYEWPNITILTCLLLLGLHEFGTCHGGRSWALGGQAIRMAFALQLHRDLEREPTPLNSGAPLSFVDREIRRRTMWACFLMDRFNSSGTDRPTFVKEETIKIQLPIKEKYFLLDMPGPTENLSGHPVTPPAGVTPDEEDDGQLHNAKDNMGVAAYMIRAIAIWGRVISYLNQGGKELDGHPMWSPESEYTRLVKQADEMQSALPPSLAFSPENLHLHETEGMANQFLFLHISIQQNILFLNRFATASPPTGGSQQDIPKTFVTKAGAKAFAAANRISELLKESESYLIGAPFVGYCAFLSSTVHIFGIFSGNPTIEATSKRNLATNVKYLSKMKRYWGMFHFMAENLREQYRTCADAARQGTPANENAVGASPIFQYGDWFDRYPHGVSNSDFVDPATYKKKEKGDDAVLEQKPQLHTPEEFFTNAGPQNAEGSANAPAAASAGGSTTINRRNSVAGSRPNATSKRKSLARKGSSVTSSRGMDQQPLGPLLTELSAANAEALRQQHEQHQQAQSISNHRRHFSASLGGQSSGPAAFSAPSLPQSQAAAAAAAAAASFHAAVMSPLTPVSMAPFSHHHQAAAAAAAAAQQQHQQHQQHQQSQQQLYSSNLIALSLAQQPGGIVPQLDRQLVFGAYGNSLDPAAAAAAAINGHNALDELGWDGAAPGGAGGQRGGQSVAAAAAAAGSSTDAMHAFGHTHDSSSAWFMPFNVEPPEFGQDITGVNSLDQLASIFGSGLHHSN